MKLSSVLRLAVLYHSTACVAYGGFAAVRRAGRCRSTAAAARRLAAATPQHGRQQQRRAMSR